MPVYQGKDDVTKIVLQKPLRIVSLVPSLTELLYSLLLEEEVVGITKFCVHPAAWQQQKVKVGGTKNIHINAIKALQPTLILASKEENIKEQIETLAAFTTVWLTDIQSLQDLYEEIHALGRITKQNIAANTLQLQISTAFSSLQKPQQIIRAAYLIWQKPYMTVGRDTFIHHMLETAGFINVFAHTTRYPIIELEDIQQQQADVVFLSSEPYPFSQKHISFFQEQLPQSKVLLVDGEMFSWYGSRLLHAPDYFKKLQNKL